MTSKQQNVDKSDSSSVLFITGNGEPMSFFLRPGPLKHKLQPLITSGGGMLCNVQKPGAILLINPDERDSILETTAHWYVSTNYIYDCIEKGQHLNVEDYRLHPEVNTRPSTRSKTTSSGTMGGRVAYTPEDDAAILSYVNKHRSETGGNRLWQEMEKQRVTSHSWQSMKYRYRVQLSKKQSETKEEENEKEENQETDTSEPSCVSAAPPHTHSRAEEAVQAETNAQPIPDESTQPENAGVETSNFPHPGEPCLDPQTDVLPVSAGGTAEPPATVSPQKESVSEDSLQSPAHTASPNKPKEKQGATRKRKQQQPQRRARRQIELEASSTSSPEPYGRKLRSSSSPSPQPAKRNKSAVKPAVQKHTTDEPLTTKRARRTTEERSAVSEGQQEDQEATVSETPKPDEGTESRPQKKTEKRKLGILELAAKEFEDQSESSEDDTPDLQSLAERGAIQPTSTEPTLQPSDAVTRQTSAQSDPEPQPSLQENVQQKPGLGNDRAQETGSSAPAASHPAATEAFHADSRAHLFIFDSESQEEELRSLDGDVTTAQSNVQPLENNDAALSLTQVQLEEDVEQIRAIMNQTNEDIVVVTKALLKTSGDLSAALDLLLDPSAIGGPFWNRYDDGLLLSADPVVRQQLLEKYGEREVAKRIVFLELEG